MTAFTGLSQRRCMKNSATSVRLDGGDEQRDHHVARAEIDVRRAHREPRENQQRDQRLDVDDRRDAVRDGCVVRDEWVSV